MTETSSVRSTHGSPDGADEQRPARLSVVVCAFSFARLEQTVSSVASLVSQDPQPAEVIVVVDYNEPLRESLAARLDDSLVVANEGRRGLSGARNTGLAYSTSEIVAFVDDDAEADPGWAAAIAAPFGDSSIAAVGGVALPSWSGPAPGWFPEELLWAVGCSYRGMVTEGPIRNPLGCNMAFRAEAIRKAGLFDSALGRVGTLPFGCEETELCVRLRRSDPGARVVIVPGAVVRHHVPAERATLRYVLRRSYYEGIGKAMMRRNADSGDLGTERRYALKVLPRAIARDLGGMALLRQPSRRAKRIAAIVGSLGLAGIGYLAGLIKRTDGPAAAAQTRVAP